MSPRPLLIAASMLAADAGRLAQEAQSMAKAGVDWLHLDVMDGHFVPNITFGPQVVAAIARATPLYCDVHLMVAEPLRWIEPYQKAGANNLTVHAEATNDLPKIVEAMTDLQVDVGISINPDTPVTCIESVLHRVQTVLVMSVEPGFGGQKYRPETTAKVAHLVRIRAERQLTYRIEVDGGINKTTISSAYEAGADVCVAGTALFGQHSYHESLAVLRQATRQKS